VERKMRVSERVGKEVGEGEGVRGVERKREKGLISSTFYVQLLHP